MPVFKIHYILKHNFVIIFYIYVAVFSIEVVEPIFIVKIGAVTLLGNNKPLKA